MKFEKTQNVLSDHSRKYQREYFDTDRLIHGQTEALIIRFGGNSNEASTNPNCSYDENSNREDDSDMIDGTEFQNQTA